MTEATESFHLVLHLAQLATAGVIFYYLIQSYKSVRSRFNLGLVIFGIAVLVEIVFGISSNVIIHALSEAAFLTALIILLYSIRK